jgi:hypothetical protein
LGRDPLSKFSKKMSIFEALDVRKRIEHEYDVVDKLSQQYIRHTHEGPQCSACGTFLVGFEPRHEPHAFFVWPCALRKC